MTTENNAKSIFEEVRTRYKSSLVGSSNKRYDLDADVFADASPEVLVKRGMRNLKSALAHERKAREAIMVNAKSSVDNDLSLSTYAMDGKHLWNMNIQKLNCDELAKMCCWRATLIPANAYYASLTHPADHALCLVGAAKTWAMTNVNGSVQIKDFQAKTASCDVWAVDVWLNTVCQISEYPEKIAVKLKKWTQAGKRISFIPPDKEDDVWAEPSGEYQTIFMNAKMSWD